MAADLSYIGPGLQRRQDGTTAVPTSGSLDVESGAALKLAGTTVTATAAELNKLHATAHAAIIDVTGGSTTDAEARTAVNAILATLRTFGLVAP